MILEMKPKDLKREIPYFYLTYFDEELRVPEIRTLFYIGNHDEHEHDSSDDSYWLFQRAASYFDTKCGSETEGLISLTNLHSLYDWDGLVRELSENRSSQRLGKAHD